jgi:hypothetical protein
MSPTDFPDEAIISRFGRFLPFHVPRQAILYRRALLSRTRVWLSPIPPNPKCFCRIFSRGWRIIGCSSSAGKTCQSGMYSPNRRFSHAAAPQGRALGRGSPAAAIAIPGPFGARLLGMARGCEPSTGGGVKVQAGDAGPNVGALCANGPGNVRRDRERVQRRQALEVHTQVQLLSARVPVQTLTEHG